MECKQVEYFINVIFILIIYKIRISSSSCKCSGSTIDCSRLKLTRMTWSNREECNETLSTEKVVLDFSHNQISLTGERILPLEDVETIDLSYNNIDQLLGFGQSTLHSYLSNLVLSHNSIKSIKENDLQSLSSLKLLDVSYNRILCIEEGTFSFLFRLEYLDLSWNHLTTFAMHCPDSIEVLYFNNNRLHTFILEGTCNFKELDLTSNNFSTFPETDDSWKGNIYFGGNPEVCKSLEEREDVYTNIQCEILVKFKAGNLKGRMVRSN
ncbi:Leucine-rich repeats and immunoglobulin-like domains protein 2 [Holothuria leucospilota]|uniref:Leucine-rich repeats and immunoglobulin-like domains protein 2 n=1 Tax=Holothuria leucospilota TaxID=206669 RepID=A0A9Q1H982_HOLLE|nr:Leucine-rich repeats and immunoglobulin-like domains protein 2 [Holothuria leucospilota]